MFNKSITELRNDLRSKQYSSVELTQYFLDRIQQHDGALNCFISLTPEHALATARQADDQLARGVDLPLLGIPLAHKDIFCTNGIKTSCGSKMLDNFIAPYDATVVTKFYQAGSVLLGKTNMDEFAMGSSNETSFYGPVRNPWDTQTVPGGSSGGSAAAVAARLTPASTGTDTGGSIRQPAAFCGISGLKPTYGSVSRYGMTAFASSLDQGGPMAKSAEDLALLFDVMAGFDANDSTSVDRTGANIPLDQSIKGLRIGVPSNFFVGLDNTMAQIIQEAAQELTRLGAELVDIDLSACDLSVPAYYVIAPAECSSNLARFDGVRYGYRCESPADLTDLYKRSRGEGFGAEVKRRIMMGAYALSAGYYDAYYLKAQKIRRLIRDNFMDAFEQVDVILTPTTPTTAFKLGEKSDDPVSMYLSDIYTIAVNLAGLPALSVPAGFNDNLPVGLQLIGNYFMESQLLNVAHAYQQVTDWHQRCPAAFA
jgi:aspartyl-tRNA(Asn)/glutamyl-tRNA(Gln) amidotransferase subunit A